MTGEPHVIRLRGPWRYELPEGASLPELAGVPLPRTGTLNLPAERCRLHDLGYSGPVTYRRRFHTPTGLEPGVQVLLVIAESNCAGAILLNGKSLGNLATNTTFTSPPVEQLLAAHNEVVLHISAPGEMPGQVYLEIRAANLLAGGTSFP
ncbi:MAG: hypothetical protein JSS27_18705 [Planctomycetes bacterium]|nr:hypothetical protein [Planctomycetota bacterium]